MTATLPATYAATRDSLHRLATYVISPARAATNPRAVALRATPGGFGTAPFGPDGTVLRVEGDHLVREAGGARRTEPITSLAAAGALAGIAPAVELEARFDVPPAGDLDAQLPLDAAASRAVGAWFALATAALETLRAEAAEADAATIVRIWPEHFDAAIELGPEGRRGTFGASPGDRHDPHPYLYASPWAGTGDDPFWNAEGFSGAWLRHADVAAAADPLAAALAFYRDARGRILGA